MKNYLAIFTGSESGSQAWQALDAQTQKSRTAEGMAAWHKWVADHQADIVAMGGPLGKTIRVDAEGLKDIRNAMAAYTIVRAQTHQDAAKMFLNHPHFSIFPGDGVEIMEVMPVPGGDVGG